MTKSKGATSVANTTSDNILLVAERLFSESGYDAVSIRSIARGADTNLSSIYHHFGSKKELLRAVVNRWALPLNAERELLLKACREHAENQNPKLDCVLRAYIGPTLRLSRKRDGGETFKRLFSHLIFAPSPEVQSVMTEIFLESHKSFIEAMRACGLEMDDETFALSVQCIYGTMSYSMYDQKLLKVALGSRTAAYRDISAQLERIVSFLTNSIVANIGQEINPEP